MTVVIRRCHMSDTEAEKGTALDLPPCRDKPNCFKHRRRAHRGRSYGAANSAALKALVAGAVVTVLIFLLTLRIMNVGQTAVRPCIVTADFWGLPTAGGTATAMELLARQLMHKTPGGGSPHFVGVADACGNDLKASFDKLHLDLKAGGAKATLLCGLDYVAITRPYEAAGMAVLDWLVNTPDGRQCDIVHTHEWGGLALPWVTAARFSQRGNRLYRNSQPSLPPTLVQLHGGMLWSTQNMERPEDVMSLRIDAAERASVELADALSGPSRYIVDWYAARGWRLPKPRFFIPNVMPQMVDPNLKDGGELQDPAKAKMVGIAAWKPVWRIAFFGRLEERKGLKLFLAALKRLSPKFKSELPNFEVLVMGARGVVDDVAADEWLEPQLEALSIPYRLLVNLPRNDALKLISEPGILLVLCTTVENAPFSFAEAALLGVPFLAFDVGGIVDVIDIETANLVQFDAQNLEKTTSHLTSAIVSLMQAGRAKVTGLAQHATKGGELWQTFHTRHGQGAELVLRKKGKETIRSVGGVFRSVWGLLVSMVTKPPQLLLPKGHVHRCPALPTIIIPDKDKDLRQLHAKVCSDDNLSSENFEDLILLLPSNFAFDPEGIWPEVCPSIAENIGDDALMAGVWVSDDQATFPASPTWIAYAGMDKDGVWLSSCSLNSPIILKRQTLCHHGGLHARSFDNFSTFTFALMLRKRGHSIHTYPDILFDINDWSDHGSQCLPDRLPNVRFNADTVVNFRYDPLFTLFKRLTVSRNAFVDFERDFPGKGKGWWGVGWGASPGHVIPFVPSGTVDNEYGCTSTSGPRPGWQGQTLIPCSTKCCYRGLPAPAHFWFKSWFALPKVDLVLQYRLCPTCGDGAVVKITHNNAVLHAASFDGKSKSCTGHIVRATLKNMRIDDRITVSVYPNGNHDCDELFLRSFRLFA